MATHVGRNFCLAPFTQITYGPRGNYSPCPEIGGRPWASEDSIVKLWSSEELQTLRSAFSDNQQSEVCTRCWEQEATGNRSLRKRLFTTSHLKENIIEFIQEDYKAGPRQINLMTGNLCNLRCRICNAGLSVTYNTEGQHYEELYNLPGSRYTSEEKKQLGFTEQQIQEIFELSKNLIRLEFYGGEPLLDVPTLSLLEKLVESGQSKNITLFYNTNGITKPLRRHYDLWNQFKSLELNLSYDDFGQRFTYQRHPAQWSDALDNLQDLKTYVKDIPVQYQIICTISVFNVFYLDQILKEFEQFDMPIFLNTLNTPDYYDIRYLPRPVREKIYDHLSDTDQRTRFIKKMLLDDNNNNQWDQFKFWTNAKDLYRKESFKLTFPEFYKILNEYDTTF